MIKLRNANNRNLVNPQTNYLAMEPVIISSHIQNEKDIYCFDYDTLLLTRANITASSTNITMERVVFE